MALVRPPDMVKLLCGMIASRPALFTEAEKALSDAFGAIDATSEVFDFDFTHYYDAQMGTPLHRKFVSFAPQVRPDSLADAKIRTNAIEADFAERLRQECGVERPVNLDVGYIAPGKLVLASMKDFSHRIYLSQGAYAEVTLQFRGGQWRSLPWTFPDYASGRYDAFLTETRQRLRDASRAEARSC
jgi:uncharacterized protein DUF4416